MNVYAIPVLKEYGNTNFITGMRAIAALMVVLIHTGGAGLRNLGEIGNQIVDFGSSGVLVFFVISGFSVATSYEKSPSFRVYLSNRLRRILPLFYFWLIFMWLWKGLDAPSLASYLGSKFTYHLLMWIPLLHYVDFNVRGLIGVEWTLSVEVFWYVLMPLMLLLINGRITAILSIPAAFVAYHFMRDWSLTHPVAFNVPPGSETAAFFTGPLAYVFCFTCGIAAYRLRSKYLYRFGDVAFLAVGALFLLYLVAPQSLLSNRFDLLIFVAAMTGTCILFGSNESYFCRVILCNPVALFLGTISYGLYLSHLPAHYFVLMSGIAPPQTALMFFASAGLCIIFSTITYLCIERPFQRRSVVAPAATDIPAVHRI